MKIKIALIFLLFPLFVFSDVHFFNNKGSNSFFCLLLDTDSSITKVVSANSLKAINEDSILKLEFIDAVSYWTKNKKILKSKNFKTEISLYTNKLFLNGEPIQAEDLLKAIEGE